MTVSNNSTNKPFGSGSTPLTTDSQGKSSGPAASMADLMSRQSNKFQILEKGQQVSGIIKKLTPREILMDIGAKGDALVIEFDKQNVENLLSFLKVGDRVNATVISPESEEGFPVLSLRRTLDDIIFGRFGELSKKEEAFEVEITEATRGGYFAMTSEGIRGFLPNSQVLKEDGLVGSKIQVKILEFDRAKKRVVFSQKAINYLMNPQAIAGFVKPNDAVEAEVTSVTPYGLFVSILKDSSKPFPDGRLIEGFIHISEVSYERVENLNQKFKPGDKIKAQVIEIDSSNKRVNLSIKRTQKDAFTQVKEKYKIEQKIKGTVKDVKSRGITVEIEAGIKGFIPGDKIASGVSYVSGQAIEAEVVEIDEKRRVVVLSPILKAVPIGYR